MITPSNELLFALAHTTVCLAIAVLIVGFVLRTSRIASPTVHRLCWFLTLALGWAFVGWSIEIPWYEPQAAAVVIEPVSPPVVIAPSVEHPSVAPLEMLEMSTASTNLVTAAPPIWNDELAVDSEAASTVDLPLVELSPIAAPPMELANAAPLVADPTEKMDEMPTVTGSRVTWPAALTALWLIGMLLTVFLWMAGYVAFLRRVRFRQPNAVWESEWIALLAGSERAARIPLRVTDKLGPMLCRLPSGYELLVPEALWADLDTEGRLAILRHELAHFQRGDVWKSIALRLLALPHWFNPFAWYATRRFDEAAEWACDLAAAADDQPTRYARMLLKLGEGAQRHAAYSPAMSGHALASRIRRLLTPYHEDSILKKLCIAATIVALLIAATLRLQLVAKEPAADDAETQASQAEVAGETELVEIEPGAVQSIPSETAAARKLQPLDVLRILVEGTPPESPIEGAFLIEPDGQIVLPAGYGRIKIDGLTRDEAEQAILTHLKRILTAPEIATSWLGQARLFRRAVLPESLTMNIGEKYRVQIDRLSPPYNKVIEVDREGRLVLGPGLPAPSVAGMTLAEANQTLIAALEQTVVQPDAIITPADLTRTYVIVEPDDPLQVGPGTLLRIQVEGTPNEHPIDGEFVVYPDRTISLGLGYGTVEAADTTRETADRVREHLKKILAAPEVAVSLAGWDPNNLVTDQNVVDIREKESRGANKPGSAEVETELVAAARKTYEEVARAYQVGTVTLGAVVEWSERWMNAALEDAQSDEARTKAAQSHLARMQAVRDEIKNLHDLGARGGEADKLAAMDFHVAAAKRRLEAVVKRSQREQPAQAGELESMKRELERANMALNEAQQRLQQSLASAERVPSATDAESAEKTALAEVAAARKAYEAVEKAYERGTITLDILIEWSGRWMEAAMKAAKTPTEQMQAADEHYLRLATVRDWLRRKKAEKKDSVIGDDMLAVIDLHVEAAQRRVNDLRSKLHNKSRGGQANMESRLRGRLADFHPAAPTTRIVTIQGPNQSMVGDESLFNLVIDNSRNEALEDLKILVSGEASKSNPRIEPVRATNGFSFEQDDMMWRVDTLPPGRQLRLQVVYRCLSPGDDVVVSAKAIAKVDGRDVPFGSARATLVVIEPSEKPDTSPLKPITPATDTTGPRYDGKSFDEWATILANDLSPESRAQAIRALTAIGTRERGLDAARLIIQAMRDYDSWSMDASPEGKLKKEAFDAFSARNRATFAPDPAVPLLLESLNSESANERLFAAQVLWRMQRKEAVPALFKLTRDDDPRVRMIALTALSELDGRSPEFKEAVRRAMQDSDNQVVLGGVAKVLPIQPTGGKLLDRGEFETELLATIPRLIELAEDDSREAYVRNWAIQALQLLGKDAAAAVPTLERLADLTSDTPLGANIATHAKLALAAIQDQPKTKSAGGFGVPPIKPVPAGARYDGKSFEEWATILANDLSPESRAQAIRALTAIGTRERAGEAAKLIIQAMSDINVREEGAEGRGKVARDALAAFSPTDANSPHIPSDVAGPALVAALKSDNANQRLFAVHALYRMSKIELLPELLAATRDDDPRVRGDAIWMLNLSQGRSLPGFDEALRRLLHDADLDVLRQAVQCFRYYPEGETFLDRAKYADELAQAARTLIAAAQDTQRNAFARASALGTLEHIGAQAAGVIPELEKLADSPEAAQQKIQHYLNQQVQTISLAERAQIVIAAIRGELQADSETTNESATP